MWMTRDLDRVTFRKLPNRRRYRESAAFTIKWNYLELLNNSALDSTEAISSMKAALKQSLK